nr:sperm axonemal maintenance protein CFAP97D1 [Anolis sagrei ordinatus]
MSRFEIITFPVVVANSRHRLPVEKKQPQTWDIPRRLKPEPARRRLDNRPLDAQPHHYFKVTKIQEAQKKIGLIERENKSLSTRLANIYRGTGMVDCWNEYQQKSKMRQKQNMEIVRISMENQAILKRIRERKPTYDRRQSELDWQNSRKYLRNTTCFLISNREKLGAVRSNKAFGTARL